MFEELENKVVLVTGAATGIGKSIAENFGKAKAKVVINYRSDRHHDEIEEIKQTVAKFGGQTLVVQGDVSIEEDIKRMIETTINHFGTLDIIINNAGFENSIPTHEMSIDDWQKVIDINLTGAFVGSREAINQFLKECQWNMLSTVFVLIIYPQGQFLLNTLKKNFLTQRRVKKQ